jgi:hypothetical protein
MHLLYTLNLSIVAWDFGVGIASRYGLNGPRIESRWRQDLPHPSRPTLGPTQPLIQWVQGLVPEVKRQGRGGNHPHPSSAEVQ